MIKLNIDKKMLSFLLFSILIVTTAAAWARGTTYTPTSFSEADPVETETTAEETPPSEQSSFINTLVLGIDQDGLADVIIVASYNLNTNKVILISIPRDTYVENQPWADPEAGLSQLCFAHYSGMGPEQNYHRGAIYTSRWVETLFGLPIHEYLVITFEAFVELVDLAGGVELYVDPAFEGIRLSFFGKRTDPLPTGNQRLNGIQTFAYAHYRGHPNNPRIPEPGSDSEDGDRVRRNQRLIKALYNQARSLKMNELLAIARKVPDLITTSYTLWDLTALAPKLNKVELSQLKTIVIPGETVWLTTAAGKETHYFYVDFTQSEKLMQEYGLTAASAATP
jgi:polyisoprenyl-teichoic acid--peptidoglycan teichoic acid transferase